MLRTTRLLDALFQRRTTLRRREPETQLSELAHHDPRGTRGKARGRGGPRGSVAPKYRNPSDPAQSLIEADANKSRSIPGSEWNRKIDPQRASRAVNEYLATLDDVAYGAATQVVPKFVSPSDPAAQWTGAMKSAAFFAYADNYLIDVKFGVIMDVEASRAVRQAEVGASRTMIKRKRWCDHTSTGSSAGRHRCGDQAARRTLDCSAQAHGRSSSSFWAGQPLTSLARISAR